MTDRDRDLRDRRPRPRCRRLVGSRAAIGMVATVLAVVGSVAPGEATVAAPFTVTASGRGEVPAFVQDGMPITDAPDPSVERFGDTYYAYTTGTQWGNHIGILTSTAPDRGFRTLTGEAYGSSAFPATDWRSPVRPWQRAGTTHAPAVIRRGGRFVMYYTAQTAAGHGGRYCLSVATASRPEGPFVDRTTKPWLCMDFACGAIDPDPVVSGDRLFLLFKTYDDACSTTQRARIWSVPLTANGLAFAAWPRPIVDQFALAPQTGTIENPQMLRVAGRFLLLFSRGDWDSSGYYMASLWCRTPLGPCGPERNRLVATYRSVRGPGGGTAYRDPAGQAWLAYHGWQGPDGCTAYRPDDLCSRNLFVARLGI
ncbi:MAG: family 43 glycosylhydrolase [Actinomycetota bacterium]